MIPKLHQNDERVSLLLFIIYSCYAGISSSENIAHLQITMVAEPELAVSDSPTLVPVDKGEKNKIIASSSVN